MFSAAFHNINSIGVPFRPKFHKINLSHWFPVSIYKHPLDSTYYGFTRNSIFPASFLSWPQLSLQANNSNNSTLMPVICKLFFPNINSFGLFFFWLTKSQRLILVWDFSSITWPLMVGVKPSPPVAYSRDNTKFPKPLILKQCPGLFERTEAHNSAEVS